MSYREETVAVRDRHIRLLRAGTGQPLPVNEGMARLVVPGDKKGGRYVSNIVKITVRSAP